MLTSFFHLILKQASTLNAFGFASWLHSAAALAHQITAKVSPHPRALCSEPITMQVYVHVAHRLLGGNVSKEAGSSSISLTRDAQNLDE